MSTGLLKGVAFIAGLLSWQGAQRIGAFLGLVWFHLVRIRRSTVFDNLRLALPDRISDHFSIARQAYRHFGMTAMEFFRMNRMSAGEIRGRVHTTGLDHFQRALDRGRGVIVITAHFGNFDLLACSQAARGVPLAIVSKELHGQGSNRFWMETRQAAGLTIFKEGAARQVLKWLKSGKVLGLTVDQRALPQEGGILAPFMGVPAWTHTAPALLALRSGAAVVPVRIERREDGDHQLIVDPEIPLPPERDAVAVAALTHSINTVIGQWVSRAPAHWMWLHRRFAEVNHLELESTSTKR